MTCTKCGGLGINDGEEVKCLNCGKRADEPERTIMTRDAEDEPKKCNRCAAPAVPGKKQCEPHLEEAREYQRRRAAKINGRREPKKQRGGGTTNAVVPVGQAGVSAPAGRAGVKVPKASVARPVKPPDLVGHALAGLDAAIGTLQADVQALERAKEILSR